MNRAVISLVDLTNAPEDVRKAAETHLAKGYRLTNEKRTFCTTPWRLKRWRE